MVDLLVGLVDLSVYRVYQNDNWLSVGAGDDHAGKPNTHTDIVCNNYRSSFNMVVDGNKALLTRVG